MKLKKIIVCGLIVSSFVVADYICMASEPVADVSVIVVKGDKVYDTTTGDDGRFSLTKLPTGKYTVSFLAFPNVVSMILKSDGKDNVSILSPVPETGGVDTHIEFTRKGKGLSGKITEDVLPEPTPMPSPEPTPE